MTPLDLIGIKARAEAATPGPWNGGHRCDGVIRAGASGERFSLAEVYGRADAAHIAGVSPDVALALVDEIERLRAVEQQQDDPAFVRVSKSYLAKLEALLVERQARP